MLTETDMLKEVDGLKKFAVKLCGNTADADDLLQTTLLKALDNRDKYVNDGRAFSWLSRIMFNSYVTAYRRKTRFETQYDPEPVLLAAPINPDQEDKMMISEIQDAMQTLRPEYRQILMMVCAYGLSYDEVAKHLEIPVGTVRSRLSRARDMLQSRLASQDRSSRTIHRQVLGTMH